MIRKIRIALSTITYDRKIWAWAWVSSGNTHYIHVKGFIADHNSSGMTTGQCHSII